MKTLLFLFLFSIVLSLIRNGCVTPRECYLELVESLELDRVNMDTQLDLYKKLYSEYSATTEALEKRVNNMSTLTYMNIFYPVNSIYSMFGAGSPPHHGDGDVRWELLPEGFALLTSSGANAGNRDGSNRLDAGATAPTVLTIDQLPSHNHIGGSGVEFPLRGSAGKTEWRHHSSTQDDHHYIVNTEPRGSNQPHSHIISAQNIKLSIWKRIS